MNAWCALIAYAAITMPSISACGLFSSVGMSLHAPGSDSSAFTTR
jgi:hypothetical protein